MKLHALKDKLLSLAGQTTESLEAAAANSWTISPTESQIVPSGVYLPSDLARITDAWPGSTIQNEIRLLKGGMVEHAASIAYRILDVHVVDGALYSGRWKQRLLARKAGLLDRMPEKKIKSGVLACTWSGNHYFGHLLTDDLPLNIAAQEIGRAIVLNRKAYPHEPTYRDLLNIHCEQITNAYVNELIVLQDFGQNSYKRHRYELMRSRIRHQVNPAKAKGIFLARGDLGNKRLIVNAVELKEFLQGEGFLIVEPERLTATEILTKMMGAELVLGIDGSQMLHGLLTMAEGGTMLCFQEPYRFNLTIKQYVDCLGMRYAVQVGYPDEGGIRVDIEELKLLLSKIETEVTCR